MTDAELLARLEGVFAETERLASEVRADQWDAATPCARWNVGQLLAHMVGGPDSFGAIVEGLPMPTEEATVTAVEVAAKYHLAADRAMGGLRVPGAIDRVFEPPWGASPGRLLAGFLLIETIVHGWDLARATGQTATFAADAVTAALEIARASTDEAVRSPEFFGPVVDVPADAAPLEQLVAFLGRTP